MSKVQKCAGLEYIDYFILMVRCRTVYFNISLKKLINKQWVFITVTKTDTFSQRLTHFLMSMMLAQ